jgi:hypothetical protein
MSGHYETSSRKAEKPDGREVSIFSFDVRHPRYRSVSAVFVECENISPGILPAKTVSIQTEFHGDLGQIKSGVIQYKGEHMNRFFSTLTVFRDLAF